MDKHTIILTFEYGCIQHRIECPFDPSDESRPCWPMDVTSSSYSRSIAGDSVYDSGCEIKNIFNHQYENVEFDMPIEFLADIINVPDDDGGLQHIITTGPVIDYDQSIKKVSSELKRLLD